jgi:hypothetical protein
MAPVARMPVPLRLAPQTVDAAAQVAFGRGIAPEVLAGAEKPDEQEGRLDDVAAIVLAAEGDGAAGATVQKMRKDAVVALGPLEEVHDEAEPLHGLASADPAARAGGDDRHDAEARSARGDGVRPVERMDIAPVAHEPAHRMRQVPEAAKGLPLYQIEQGFVGG